MWTKVVSWLRLGSDKLLPRVAAVHIVAACLLAVGWMAGPARAAVLGATPVSWVIVAILAARVLLDVLVCVRVDRVGAYDAGSTYKHYLPWLGQFDLAFPALGFVGTLIGSIAAFDAVDPSATAAAMPQVISGVLRGLSTALNATLVGIAAALWTTQTTTLIGQRLDP